MTHEFHQPSQQRPGIEMGLYQQRHRHFEVKGTEKAGGKRGKLSDFIDLRRWEP